MQRSYEVMFILRPDLADDEADKLIAALESNATAAGAQLQSTDRMGKRRLAYTVRGFNDGSYILLKVNADGKAIHELERRLRVNEPVIKFITVRTDLSQKRVAKFNALRASRVKRSAVEAAANAAAASAAASAAAAATPAPETPTAPTGA